MINYYEKNKEQITKFLIITIIIVFIFMIKYMVMLFLPFLIGYGISNMLKSYEENIEKNFKVGRVIASIFTIIMFLLASSIIIFFIYTFLKPLVINLIGDAPMYFKKIELIISNIKQYIMDMNKIPDFIKGSIYFTIEGINGIAINLGGGIAKSIVFSVPKIFMVIVISTISSFFFLIDRELIYNTFGDIVPNIIKLSMSSLKKAIEIALSGYVKAQLILMTMTFTIASIGIYIAGFEHYIIVGLIIGLIDALPMFGSGFILYPWVAYLIGIGEYRDGVYLIITYIIIFLNRQIFEPKILGKQIGLHPLLTLGSIYVGYSIIGIGGLILGPVIFIIIKIVLESDIK